MTDENEDKAKTEQAQDDVKENPSQDTGKEAPEKITLTQKELNSQLASARRESEAKLRELQAEYNGYKQTVEQREQAANDAAAEKVEALRKDLPEAIQELLDNLSPSKQLEWLQNPANTITKKEIPPLPAAAGGHGNQRKSIKVI
jgi:hypothetical protein